MMTLICMEIRKLLHQKSLVSLFLLLIVANISCLYYTQATQTIPISAYQTLQQKLSTLPNEERYAYIDSYHEQIDAFRTLQQLQFLQIDPIGNQEMIEYLHLQYPDIEKNYGSLYQDFQPQYTTSLETEALFLASVKEEMGILHSYPETLKEIQQKASSISSVSIFSDPTSFAIRNIQKTAKDFQRMEHLVPIYQPEKGVYEALTFPFTDFLILLFSMAVVSSCILEEKQKGLLPLVRTMRLGDWHTMMAKLIAVTLAIGMLTGILCIANLICMQLLCGLGDLDAPLISLASFTMSTLTLSIKQFLLSFILTKWLAACAIGAMMLGIAVYAKQKASCFFAIFAILSIELFLYFSFQDTHPLHLLKQINIITFLQTTSLYTRYLNIDIFTYPITFQTIAFFFLFLIFSLCGVITCRIYQKQQDLRLHNATLINRLSFHKHAPSGSLFLEEVYKLFWVQKAFFILLCFLLLQGFFYYDRALVVSQEEQNWMAYMDQIEGMEDEEITSFISSQKSHFEQLEQRLQAIDEQYQAQRITSTQRDVMKGPIELQLYGQATFEAIVERYAYVQEDKSRSLCIPFAYERLFSGNAAMLLLSMLFLCILLLSISDIQCMEHHHAVQNLLSTTPFGRTKQVYYKLCLAMLLSCISLSIAFLPELLRLRQAFSFPALTSSITSLPQFAHLPSGITILAFLLFMALLHLFAAFVLVALLFLFSNLWKTQRSVLCILFLFIFIPLGLSLIGFHYLDGISLKPLLCASTYVMEENTAPLYFSIFFYSAILIISLTHTISNVKHPK